MLKKNQGFPIIVYFDLVVDEKKIYGHSTLTHMTEKNAMKIYLSISRTSRSEISKV